MNLVTHIKSTVLPFYYFVFNYFEVCGVRIKLLNDSIERANRGPSDHSCLIFHCLMSLRTWSKLWHSFLFTLSLSSQIFHVLNWSKFIIWCSKHYQVDNLVSKKIEKQSLVSKSIKSVCYLRTNKYIILIF